MAKFDTGTPLPKKRGKYKKKKRNSIAYTFQSFFPVKGDSLGEVIRKLVLLVAIGVLIWAFVVIILAYTSDYSAVEHHENILKLRNQPPTSEQVAALPDYSTNVEFAALYERNNDFVGQIHIPGTNVDYPVTQTTDNDYYLKHDFDKQLRDAGSVFADYEGKIGPGEMPDNTILYGHNMRDKFQFQALMNYKNIEFLKASPVVKFDTLYGNNTYKIIGAILVNTLDEHSDDTFHFQRGVYFENRDSFNQYITEILDRSYFHTGVDVEYGDQLLTLSTCDFSALSELRFVVFARKVRENESPQVDTEKIVVNESRKMFEAWYDVFGGEWEGRSWDDSFLTN